MTETHIDIGRSRDPLQTTTGTSTYERRLSRGILVATALTFVVYRLWVASAALMPKGPDVLGPWAAAFHLAGADPAIDMHRLPPYSVGMGAVLAPLVRLFDDPRTRYQAAVVLLGGLALLAGWLMARFLRSRATTTQLGLTMGFATTVGLTAVAFFSSFTWAEPLALLWLAGWLALVAWGLSGSTTRVVVVAIYSSTGLLVHGRFVLVPAAWAIGVAVLSAMDVTKARRSRREAVLQIGATAVITVLTSLAVGWARMSVIAGAWSDPNLASDTKILSNLPDPAFWRATLIELAGQMWYLGASTAGLGLVGLIVLVRSSLTFSANGEGGTRRLSAVALLGLASVSLVSVLFIAGALVDLAPSRLDYLVYGRYLDQVAVILAAVGVTHLIDAERVQALKLVGASLVFVAFSGVGLRVIRGGLDDTQFAVNEAVISGVASLPFDRPGLDIVRWSMLAIAAGSAIGLARLGGRALMAIATAFLLFLGSAAGSTRAVQEHRAWDNSVLYENYPRAPQDSPAAMVAEDALEGLAYQFNFPAQQYALADEGWSFEVASLPSEELRTQVDASTGMVVLKYDVSPPPGEWCHLPAYDQILIWVRFSPGSGASTGASCDLGDN